MPKQNLAGAIRAVRRGGKALSKMTGNPDDAKIKATPLRSQERLGDLARGFGLVRSKKGK